MGNTISYINILSITEDVLLHLLGFLENDWRTLARFSQTSRRCYHLVNNEKMWKKFAKKLNYEKIAEIKKRKLTWKNSYFTYLDSPIKSLVVSVANNVPHSKFLIQLKGDGKCFISDDLENPRKGPHRYHVEFENLVFHMNEITETSTYLYDPLNDLGKITKHLPFTKDNTKYYEIRNRITLLNSVRFIDIDSYDPTILLLTNDNRIFEFLITPKWMRDFKEHLIPNEVKFPLEKNEKIKKMICNEIGCFVISNFPKKEENKKCNVYFWTHVDNSDIIPKLIGPLSALDIIDINYLDKEYTCIIHIDDKMEKCYTKIENTQLFMFIT